MSSARVSELSVVDDDGGCLAGQEGGLGVPVAEEAASTCAEALQSGDLLENAAAVGPVLANIGCEPRACGNHMYACGDCEDNDGDGLVDMDDPDCLGPCHNDEASFDLGIPGANNSGCGHDCYFDQDSGSGNDHCKYNTRCDPLVPQDGCEYDPDTRLHGSGLACEYVLFSQTASCQRRCLRLAPPGCDCFGCCENPSVPGDFFWLASTDPDGQPTCGWQTVSDASKCHPCTPVDTCYKPCGRCDRCPGKLELPDDCASDPGPT